MDRHWSTLWWPLIVIGLGVIFLLNNLLGWSIWKLWPVLLILLGSSILVGGRGSPGTKIEIEQSLEGAAAADVTISPGVSELHVGPLAEPNQLIEGTISVGRAQSVTPEFRLKGDTAHYRLKSRGHFAFPFWGGWQRDYTWDLQLNQHVPTRLTIDAGVGQSTLDLSELSLTYLKIDAGVGQTNLTLPRWGQLEVVIQAGVGEVSVGIPWEMAACIQTSTGLGSTRIKGNYQRRGGAHVSPDYDTAENRVDLKIGGGVGAINVRQLES